MNPNQEQSVRQPESSQVKEEISNRESREIRERVEDSDDNRESHESREDFDELESSFASFREFSGGSTSSGGIQAMAWVGRANSMNSSRP